MANYYGSICLSDIPKRLIKIASNGKAYLNISVVQKKEVDQYGNSHFIACSCKKDEEIEGENRFVGDLKVATPKVTAPTPEDIENMPSAEQGALDDLPF